jgi:hypothetical protein
VGKDISTFKGRSTLRLIQSVKTIPKAFPTQMNTCGRICVHKSGRFVVVSNRGHQSIAIFRVSGAGPRRGELSAVGYFHTRGETPRHFQFDASGQFLLVANQDTDSIAVFNFNLSSGEMQYLQEYRVPSPNFVCCCPMSRDDDDEKGEPTATPPHETTVIDNLTVVQHPESLSDSSQQSVNSCIPTLLEKDVHEELARARAEIEQLKAALLSLKKAEEVV